MKSLSLAVVGLCLLAGAAQAQSQDPSGTYLSESGDTRVRIARCGSAYCGTIVAVQGEAERRGGGGGGHRRVPVKRCDVL